MKEKKCWLNVWLVKLTEKNVPLSVWSCFFSLLYFMRELSSMLTRKPNIINNNNSFSVTYQHTCIQQTNCSSKPQFHLLFYYDVVNVFFYSQFFFFLGFFHANEIYTSNELREWKRNEIIVIAQWTQENFLTDQPFMYIKK